MSTRRPFSAASANANLTERSPYSRVSSKCGIAPTTSTPMSTALRMRSSPPSKDMIPCCGNATSWSVIWSPISLRSSVRACTALSCGSQTSTWLRTNWTPLASCQRSTVRTRRFTSSTLSCLTRSAQIAMPSNSEPDSLCRGSPTVRTASRWMWGSTSAGVTSAPPRSMTWRASGSSSLIRPPEMPMSRVSSSPGSRAPRRIRSSICEPRRPGQTRPSTRGYQTLKLRDVAGSVQLGEAPMQTIEEVEKHVPIREGEYGERVATVEPGGVEFISHTERHGKPIQMFWTWLSPNLEFATVFVGVLGVAIFGLSFWETAVAILLGSALGSLTHFVLSSWGPKFGVPMMVESRGAFGFLGNILPAGLNGLTGSIGWFIVNSVSGAFALQALALLVNWNLPFWLTFLVIVVAQVVIATFGHNFIHLFERFALLLLGVVFILATVFIFSHANVGAGAQAGVNHFASFTLLLTATFGYAAGWNPYAADYTRYLPPTVNRQAVGMWAALGVFVSCVVIELAGAALATVSGTKWGPNDIPTVQLSVAMPSWLYYLTLLCIAVGAVCANAINIYSGTMSLVAIGIKEMGMTLRQRRALLAVAAGVLGYVIGLVGQANVGPGSKY